MTFVMLILLVVVASAALTLRMILHDGRGHRPPPASHVQDPRFRAPRAWA